MAEGYTNIMELVRMDDIGYDPWGTAMQHWFGIANVLTVNVYDVPAHWQYRPGADETTEEWPDSEYQWLLDEGYVTADDLRRAGNVLARYARACERAGRSY